MLLVSELLEYQPETYNPLDSRFIPLSLMGQLKRQVTEKSHIGEERRSPVIALVLQSIDMKFMSKQMTKCM